MARSFPPSQRSQTVPTQGPVSWGVSEVTGHREGCQGGNSTALSFFRSPHLCPTHPSTREGRTGVLRCSQGDQVTARSNASFKGTSRLEAEVQLDCRVFPSGPDAATGASGAPKTACTSSERAKTKTSQDSCHFRRLEGCRNHATH